MVEPLRSRLLAADLPRVWMRTGGELLAAPRTAEQSAGVAVSVVHGWLSDHLDDTSWIPADPYALEDHRGIVARALSVLIEHLEAW